MDNKIEVEKSFVRNEKFYCTRNLPDFMYPNMTITRAPDVHLRRWLVQSAAFFKTKSSKTLPMLKYNEKDNFFDKISEDGHNSSSRRPFETLTSAFDSIFQN